jgi:glycerophosphoryl diester phosphodiesterase
MLVAASGNGAAAPIRAVKPDPSPPAPKLPVRAHSSGAGDAQAGARAITSNPGPAADPKVNFITEAERTGRKLVIAHRGGAASENFTTLAGIEAQARHGNDPIEIKPQRLGDGTIVAHAGRELHDGSNDHVKLADLTLAQLRGGTSYDHVPTLAEIGDTARKLGVKIALNIDPNSIDGDEVELARDSITSLTRHLPNDDAVVFSRDAATDTLLARNLASHHIEPFELDPATAPGSRPRTQLDALRKTAMDGISDAVEVDWNHLKDGTVVANHDPSLHEGPLKGRLLQDVTLQELRAAGYDDIPTVDEYAAAAAKLDINVVADIKSAGIEHDVMDGLLRHLPKERVSAFSFEPSVVRNLDERHPDIPIGFLPRQYDSYDRFERIRQQALGDAVEQIRSLGITPDYIEVSSDNVNTKVLDYAGRHDVTVMAGGTSADEKIQLYEDERVMGFMIDDASPMPTLRREKYDADTHGRLDGPKDQGSMWSGPVIDRIPGGEQFLNDRANDVYSWVSGSDQGRKLVHRVTQGAEAVKDTVRSAGYVARNPDVIWKRLGIGDGDDDVPFVPFL